MVPFQSAVVALAGDMSDAALLEYAAMLDRLGLIQKLRFAYVAAPGQVGGDLEERLRAQIAVAFPAKVDSLPLETLQGDVLDQLLTLTTLLHVDLVMVGCRLDRNGRPRLAQRLAMSAPCSIWMVPQGNPPRLSRILAPVDFSEHSAVALEMAASLAQQTGGKCLAAHIYFDEAAFRFPEHASQGKKQQIAELEQFIAKIPAIVHDDISKLVEESVHVAPAVLRIAADQSCDLIVLSTRGRTAAAAILLGSEASETMDKSRLPILAIKKQGAHMGLLRAILSPETWKQSNTHTN